MTNNIASLSTSLTTELTAITPELAHDWLANHNTRNRPLNKAAVDRWASEMAQGRWQINGTTIAFDQEGTLVDGQHRLQAVVASQVTIDALVVRGVPVGSFATIDIGKLRTVTDSLKADHVIDPATKGANALTSLLGQTTRMVLSYVRRQTLVYKGKISNVEFLDYLHEYGPQLTKDVQEVTDVLPKTLPQATFAALLYLTRDPTHGSGMFERFMGDVARPDNLRASNPAKELRHYIDNLPQGSRKDGLPFKVCASWNRYAQGELGPDLSKDASTSIRPELCREMDTDQDTWQHPLHVVSEVPDEVATSEPPTDVIPKVKKVGGRKKSKVTADTSVGDTPFDLSAPHKGDSLGATGNEVSAPESAISQPIVETKAVTHADWDQIV
jgi:hypothetical protein